MVLAWVIFLIVCFLAGILAKTNYFNFIKNITAPILTKIPGYSLIRSFTNRMVQLEQNQEFDVGFVALGETNQALAPAFLIEKHEDDSYTVFVPTVPTLTVGNLYIVPGNRVFAVDAPLLDMIKFITHWGEGSTELIQAMKQIHSLNNLQP